MTTSLFISKHADEYHVYDMVSGWHIAGPFATLEAAADFIASRKESPANIPSLSVSWSK